MRILAVHPGPDWSVADVHTGWVEAFRQLGCEVYDFDYGMRVEWHNWAHHPTVVDGVVSYRKSFMDGRDTTTAAAKHIEAAAYEFWPDLVWITYGAVVPPPTMQLLRHRHTVVVHHTESPYEDDRQIALAEHGCADLHLINDPTNLERWREAAGEADVWYQPHSYRPSVHHARDRREEHGVVWGGSMWPERFEWWERFSRAQPDMDLALFGNWLICQAETHPIVDRVIHPVDEIYPNDKVAGMYRHGRTGVNMYRKVAQRDSLVDGWAMGPREVEMAACGLPFPTEARGENKQVLGFLPTFTEPEEAAEQCRWLIDHDSERRTLGERAQAAVVDRTFEAQARLLLARIDQP